MHTYIPAETLMAILDVFILKNSGETKKIEAIPGTNKGLFRHRRDMAIFKSIFIKSI